MRMRQSGLGMLVVVLLLMTVAAFAVIVAASQSSGDVYGSDATADGTQALMLAESGIERALKRFATGTACAALNETVTNLTTIGLGTTTHQIVIAAGLATDFAGAALPATQCRVPVTGTVLSRNVSRTVHAIIDRNLLGAVTGAPPPTFNPWFNNPTTGATPSGWTAINPAAAFTNGGPDGTSPNCTRSAWTARNNPGAAANDRRATASLPLQFTLTAGSTTNITFHRRVITRASDCGSLPAAGPASLPGACGAANDSTVCFQWTGTGGAGTWTVASNAAAAGAGIAACPSTFNPCQTNYQAGYPTKISLNVTMTGATSVTQFTYYLQLQNAGRKEIFVDTIEATNTTAIGAAHVRAWRDCSNALTPGTCT